MTTLSADGPRRDALRCGEWQGRAEVDAAAVRWML
jgi:hypothetical protein